MVVKATKKCDLRVHLATGAAVRGRFHVDMSTSSAIRPSDALREDKSGWLLLTDVTRESTNGDGAETRGAVMMVNRSAVVMVEIPQNNWQS